MPLHYIVWYCLFFFFQLTKKKFINFFWICYYDKNIYNMKFLILTVLKYTTQWHSLYLQCCATTVSKTFSSFQAETLYPLSNIFPFLPLLHTPLPRTLVTSILLSALMIFPFLDTLYKWNHVFVFCFWFLSLHIIFSKFIHVMAYIRSSYKWAIFHCMYFHPFICWGTFELFLPFDIVNDVAVNTGVQESVWVHFQLFWA